MKDVVDGNMTFEIITLFPNFFSAFFSRSMIAKAVRQGHCNYCIRNLRHYGLGKHKQVDDSPYGGSLQNGQTSKGKGMLIRSDVVGNALLDVKKNNEKTHIISLSPRGKLLTAKKAHALAVKPAIGVLCGHYEGIDNRANRFVDEEISIGNYVTFSGEVAGQVLMETILRLVPGVLQDDSVKAESFEDGLLECDQYTRPRTLLLQKKLPHKLLANGSFPEVLLSGNHKSIAQWRRSNAILRTYWNRPELLNHTTLSNKELWHLAEHVENQFCFKKH